MARDQLLRLLTVAGDAAPAALRARAYRALASHTWRSGGAEPTALAYFEASAAAAEAAGDLRQLAWAYNDLGNYLVLVGRLEEAMRAQEQALALKRRLGVASDVAISLANLGEVHWAAGDEARAEALFEEALALHRDAAPALLPQVRTVPGALYQAQVIRTPLQNLGRMALRRRQPERAAGYFAEGLARLRELGELRTMASHLLPGLALVAGMTDAPLTAARWLAAARAWRERWAKGEGIVLDAPWYDAEMSEVAACVEPGAWTAAWEAGQGLPLDQAVAEALERYPAPAGPST